MWALVVYINVIHFVIYKGGTEIKNEGQQNEETAEQKSESGSQDTEAKGDEVSEELVSVFSNRALKITAITVMGSLSSIGTTKYIDSFKKLESEKKGKNKIAKLSVHAGLVNGEVAGTRNADFSRDSILKVRKPKFSKRSCIGGSCNPVVNEKNNDEKEDKE